MANKELNKNIITVNTKELCEILGLSDRRIQQLAKEEILIRISHGKYDLPVSIQYYIGYIKEQSKTGEELNKTNEETLLTRAKRKKAELELDIMLGTVHLSEDVEKVMNDMLSSFKAQLLVVPGKAAPRLIGLTEIEPIKAILKNYIFEVLQELSDYDPNAFYGKSKDKIVIEDKGEENNSKTKTRPKKNGTKKQTNK